LEVGEKPGWLNRERDFALSSAREAESDHDKFINNFRDKGSLGSDGDLRESKSDVLCDASGITKEDDICLKG